MKMHKNMTTEELVELADETKRGVTKKFLENIKALEKADKLIGKKSITKNEAIMIADRIKSGMSIKVLNDLKELKHARSKVLTAG